MRREGPPATDDPFEMESDVVREYGQRARVKRRALEQKPTEKVTGTTPETGEPFTRMMSPYQMRDPFVTGPSAMQSGRLKCGDLVLMASVGAGFTVGSLLLRWGAKH